MADGEGSRGAEETEVPEDGAGSAEVGDDADDVACAAAAVAAEDVDRERTAQQSRPVDVGGRAGTPRRGRAHGLGRARDDHRPELCAEPQVEAVRWGGERTRHLERLKRGDRERAEGRLATDAAPERTSDQLTLEARWDADVDLDLLVFDPFGNRVSWQGGAKRVAAQEATRVGHERLALSADKVGRYRIMVVHANAQDDEDRPTRITGRVTVRAHGESRTLDFVTDGRRAQVGEVQILSKWRYEPLR